MKRLISLLCLCGLASIPNSASAQINISPLVIQSETQSGQASGVIDVSNFSDKPYRARVSVSPFTYDTDGFKRLSSSPNDISPYIRFSPRELVIQPGQKRSIRFNAKLLPSLPKQEYRAIFAIESLVDESQSRANQIGIDISVVSAIYVRNGNLSADLKVEKAYYDGKAKLLRFLVNNKGKATTRPRTKWDVSQNGKTINSGNLQETTVIAESDRYISIDYPLKDQNLTAGKYQLSGQLDWDFPNKGGTLPFNVNFEISNDDLKMPTPKPQQADPNSR